MPFTLLAHQAPVLPLKLLRPRWFSATALAFGSMAPDLEYFLPRLSPVSGHSMLGQLVFCLPVTLGLVYATRHLVAGPLAAHLPEGGALHLRDIGVLARPRRGSGDVVRVVTSALLGSLSHVFLDGFTHSNGWAVAEIPLLRVPVFTWRGVDVALFNALQYGGSVVLALVTLAMLLVVARRRLLLRWAGEAAPVRPADPPDRLRFWGLSLAFAALATAARLVHDHAYAYRFAITFWGFETLHAMGYAFVGVCLAALIFRSGAALRAYR